MILKGLLMKQMTQLLLEDESPTIKLRGFFQSKINTRINDKLLDGAVALQIREATGSTWDYQRVGSKPMRG